MYTRTLPNPSIQTSQPVTSEISSVTIRWKSSGRRPGARPVAASASGPDAAPGTAPETAPGAVVGW
ncbi:hypothetical protein [Nesterenkonia sp. F]|uniref:hypothetical protein n=1 Tax=Nesterenkonia sp. F TaxID=795955 RepID=UPI000255D01E|nr:hypothetical protein [Nesterenkonia sp. F]